MNALDELLAEVVEPHRFKTEDELLFERSQEFQGGLGAVAWAVLEMLRRGGMPEESLMSWYEEMTRRFARPSDEDCNAILGVVERRLAADRNPTSGRWY
jgi:hypothetical protein